MKGRAIATRRPTECACCGAAVYLAELADAAVILDPRGDPHRCPEEHLWTWRLLRRCRPARLAGFFEKDD